MNSKNWASADFLVRNSFLNFIGRIIPLLVGVITIPFIIRGLGPERFGLLSLVWVILGYFAIFDLGLGRATTKFVAEALGKGEKERIPRLVWTAVSIQATLGVIGGLVVAGITPLLVEHVLKISPALVSEAKATFYLLALSVPVVLVSGSFKGVLEAAQRFDLVNAVGIPANSLIFFLPLIGLGLGFGFLGIVVLILLSRFGTLIATIALSFHLIPELRKYSGSLSLFPHLFSFGGWVMVSSIAAPTFTYLERFFIASFLSTEALTFYAAPIEIISRITIIPISISTALFPAFSYYGGSDQAMIKELFSRPFKYLLLSMVPFLIIFVTFASEILKLWLGEEFVQRSTIVFQILTVAFFLHVFAYVPFTAIHGLGRPDLKAKLDLIMLPIFAGLCWWLIPISGLVGAALAKLVITVIDVLYLSLKAKSLSQLTIREMFGERTGNGVIIAGLFVLAAWFLKMLFESLLVELFVLSTLLFTYIFLFIKVVMDDKDRLSLQDISKAFYLYKNSGKKI